MRKVYVLLNPSKKGRKTQAFLQWLKTKQAQFSQEFLMEFFEDDWPSDLQPCDELWLYGGDGTLNYFINAHPAFQKPLVLFPGGTGNDFHYNLYGSISMEAQWEAIRRRRIQGMDAGICNGKLFLNGLGMGLEGQVLKSMRAIRFLGGALGYFLAAIPPLFWFRSYPVLAEVDGKSFQSKLFLNMVFNGRRAGGGFHFVPHAQLHDGQLDWLWVDPIPVWKRLFLMPLVQRGKHAHWPVVHFQSVRSIRFQFQKPIYAQLDGELLVNNSYDIMVLPNKFSFITL